MSLNHFLIGSKRVGPNEETFLIAEVAQTHDGSIDLAHRFVDAVADAGAHAIKFQTHFADSESTLDEPFRVKLHTKDATRFDYWKRMEFSPEEWAGLMQHALDRQLIFLSSPFSVRAVDLLEELDIPAWKIGSGEVHSQTLLDAVIKTKKPILLSTGLIEGLDELAGIVAGISDKKIPVGIFQCTTKYPTAFEDIGLNVMELIKNKFQCPVGLSDHSATIYPGMACIARGYEMLEVHVTLDKQMTGPDVIASVTMEELKILANMARATKVMNDHPIQKNDLSKSARELRVIFGKSLAPTRDLKKGEILSKELLMEKKPGHGIPIGEIEQVLGKKLRRDVPANKLLTREDF